jgi:ABC-type Fe3+/spermidine/putrescine transport system ATPase subunit
MSHDGYELGQKVLCSVRPENIRLLDRARVSNGIQAYEAKILHMTYYGMIEHYVVGGFGGIEVKVTNFNPDIKRRGEGEEVYITFDPEDVDVFPF